MMREIEKDPHLARFKKIVLHAQAQVEGFYASLGYTTVSEPFYEAGIRHVTMEKVLGANSRNGSTRNSRSTRRGCFCFWR